MQIMQVVKQLIKFAKEHTKEDVQAFYLPTADYKGYVMIFESFEQQSHNANQYFIKGTLWKQIDMLKKEENFNLLGKNYLFEDDYISFNSKKLAVMDSQQNVERGFALSCPFEAKITLINDNEQSSNLEALQVSINQEQTITIK
ncbi:hypothetical protein ABSA28_00545 [Candidatus Hepatincolaceae symbiont of Richtersius coronifer]